MPPMGLISENDPALRQPSKEVTDITAEVMPLIGDMNETMLYHKGLGLSAIQVGIPLRFFVTMIPGHQVVINPVIVKMWGANISKSEGCLSFGRRTTFIKRAEYVQAKWTDGSGKAMETVLKGMAARVFQHETDHMNGTLIFQ